MVKPVTIKIDDKTWKRFKALAKENGLTLEAAVRNIFDDQVDAWTATKKEEATR